VNSVKPSSSAQSRSVGDQRYELIRRRDRSADGTFVYSVKTTGVYCRPSCAARLANRCNVSFHETCEDAERAGFRPCKRCRPNEPGQDERYRSVVTAACRAIDTADATPTLAKLAASAGFSPYHFHRVFKSITGLTPKAYALARRAQRIADGLKCAPTVTDAIYDAGYSASSRFYENSSSRLGMKPKTYKNGGSGVAIRFAVGECSLGSILVATTERGVCAILLGDEPDDLVRDLQDRFPHADLTPGEGDFEHMVTAAIALAETPSAGIDLPLDIGGTAFQQRVWNALRQIPAGKTASYAEIAAAVGRPAAGRASAQACAANRLAMAIPCHRVIRSDGDLSGYRWGVQRKRELLAPEAANPAQ
jgi:AraC family transcriptional regulator of adaptative response/methylated-DNA-[protein]-cysteine methyltransferase